MEIIGLYDIDLWHHPKKYPNLELMKVYNYYYKQNIKVLMINPQTDLGRFTKIYYFKEHQEVNIPLSLELSGPRVQLFGYGFYGKDELLPPQIQKISPSYFPYDSYCDKLAIKKKYEFVRKHSLIRLATNDFSGLIDSKHIFVVDRAPARCNNILQTLEAYPKRKFHFFHALRMTDMKMIETFRPHLPHIENRLFVDFNFSPTFFEEQCTNISNFLFNLAARPTENPDTYTKRMLKMVLLLKKKNCSMILPQKSTDSQLLKAIQEWHKIGTQLSFAEYYRGREEESFLYTTPVDVRMLLKKNPLKVESCSLDFWSES